VKKHGLKRLVPLVFKVRDEPGDEDEIGRPSPNDLIRDVEITAASILGWGLHRRCLIPG
jgi:hypothetical protein